MFNHEYFKNKFEQDKTNSFPIAIRLMQEVAESGLTMTDQDQAIKTIKEIAKEYGVEITH